MAKLGGRVMMQSIRLAAALGVVLLIGCQTSNTLFITATAEPFVPAPENPSETATAAQTRTPTVQPTNNQPPPTFDPAIPRPSMGAPVPPGAVTRLGIGEIMVAIFSPDSRYLAVGTSVGVYVYDARSLALKWSRLSEGPVLGLAWMPFGDTIAAWNGTQNTVIGYEAGTGRTRFEFEHTGPIGGVAWSPDGTKLAVGWGGRTYYQVLQSEELEKRVTVWDVETFERLYTSILPYDTTKSGLVYINLLESLAWSVDGKWLAATSTTAPVAPQDSGYSALVFVWDAATGELVQSIQQAEVSDASFSPDSKRLAGWTYIYAHSVSDDTNVIQLWDPATGESRSEFEDPLFPDEHGAFDLEWHPDGTELIVAQQDAQIVRWDVIANKAVQRIDYPMEVRDLEMSPYAKYFGVAGWLTNESSRHQAAMWRLGDAEPLYILDKDLDFNNTAGLEISPDSSMLVVFGSRRLSIHNLADGAEISPPLLAAHFSLIEWSQDSTAVTADVGVGDFSSMCSGRRVTWDIKTMVPVYAFLGDCDSSAPTDYDLSVVSPDEKWEATVTNTMLGEETSTHWVSELIITSLSDGHTALTAAGPPAAGLRIAWSADSSMVAIGGGIFGSQGIPGIRGYVESVIMVFDVATGEQRTFLGHTGRIEELKFSPDGSQLASSSVDGTVIIWQVK